MIITDQQKQHLRNNVALVADHQRDANYPNAPFDIEEWFDFAEEDAAYEAYYYMCLDIGLDPLKPHPAG